MKKLVFTVLAALGAATLAACGSEDGATAATEDALEVSPTGRSSLHLEGFIDGRFDFRAAEGGGKETTLSISDFQGGFFAPFTSLMVCGLEGRKEAVLHDGRIRVNGHRAGSRRCPFGPIPS